MRLVPIARMTALSLLTIGLCGCDDDDSVVGTIPGVDTGTLQQSWTIEGTRDVAKCQQYNADRMRLVIFDSNGGVHATELAACGFFELSVELRTDRYTGTATFVDAQGNPVSQTKSVPAFTIVDNEIETITLDFDQAAMTL